MAILHLDETIIKTYDWLKYLSVNDFQMNYGFEQGINKAGFKSILKF